VFGGRADAEILFRIKEPVVAIGSFRRYDVQAKWSVILSTASVAVLLAVLGLLLRNYHSQIGRIMFGNPLYQMVVMGGMAVTMLLSGVGLMLGLSSAGQRRNERQKQSWTGFFLGTAVLSLTIIMLAAFWILRMQAVRQG
jgi:FtsH-binding integral membrane protein